MYGSMDSNLLMEGYAIFQATGGRSIRVARQDALAGGVETRSSETFNWQDVHVRDGVDGGKVATMLTKCCNEVEIRLAAQFPDLRRVIYDTGRE